MVDWGSVDFRIAALYADLIGVAIGNATGPPDIIVLFWQRI
jgi:hypothetical protein